MNELASRLNTILGRVRLSLDLSAGPVVVWESRRYPVTDLCLDEVDPRAEEAELLAVAAAFDAAIKYPGRIIQGEEMRLGMATLLPKVERARFGRAYDAVIAGAGKDVAVEGLYVRDLGANLITTYVQDEGWRFNYIPKGRVAVWDASPDTVHAAGRSNLYYKDEVDYRARDLHHGDGYDAARAILIEDVFYDRGGEQGCEVAIPSRDLTMVGLPGFPLSREEVEAAYKAAAYPISPEVFLFKRHQLRER